MKKRSFFYKSPLVYNFGLKLTHGENLGKRYDYISRQIGERKTVLEPACGPALLPDYLGSGCFYSGFDINGKFVKHAREKGWKVFVGDALDGRSYAPADAVVLCDALHHVGPENEKIILENSLRAARRLLVVCEPFSDFYLDRFPALLPGGRRLLAAWFDYAEKDGANRSKLENIRPKEKLKSLMEAGFGLVPEGAEREIKKIGSDLIASYWLEKIRR